MVVVVKFFFFLRQHFVYILIIENLFVFVFPEFKQKCEKKRFVRFLHVGCIFFVKKKVHVISL